MCCKCYVIHTVLCPAVCILTSKCTVYWVLLRWSADVTLHLSNTTNICSVHYIH